MSVKVMTWVWEHSEACGNDRFVLVALADHADDETWSCWPSIAKLAAKTKLSERTIQRSIQNLVEIGELSIHARDGATNVYRFLLPNKYPTITVEPPVVEETASGVRIGGVMLTPLPTSQGGDTNVTGGCQSLTGVGVTKLVTRTINRTINEPSDTPLPPSLPEKQNQTKTSDPEQAWEAGVFEALTVQIDPAVEPGTIELRHGDQAVGRIENLGTHLDPVGFAKIARSRINNVRGSQPRMTVKDGRKIRDGMIRRIASVSQEQALSALDEFCEQVYWLSYRDKAAAFLKSLDEQVRECEPPYGRRKATRGAATETGLDLTAGRSDDAHRPETPAIAQGAAGRRQWPARKFIDQWNGAVPDRKVLSGEIPTVERKLFRATNEPQPRTGMPTQREIFEENFAAICQRCKDLIEKDPDGFGYLDLHWLLKQSGVEWNWERALRPTFGWTPKQKGRKKTADDVIAEALRLGRPT